MLEAKFNPRNKFFPVMIPFTFENCRHTSHKVEPKAGFWFFVTGDSNEVFESRFYLKGSKAKAAEGSPRSFLRVLRPNERNELKLSFYHHIK